jgi:hypothetical protein
MAFLEYDEVTVPSVEFIQENEPIGIDGNWWLKPSIPKYYYKIDGRWFEEGKIGGDLGVFGAGEITGTIDVNVIDYITISTTGHATDFGDLTTERHGLSASSNGINERGVFGGGYYSSTSTYLNTIDYITILTLSNATDFGDTTIRRRYPAACSSGTNNRGVFGGGLTTGPTYLNTIDYVTISITGNATDFGDLTVARYGTGSCSNGTNDRGVFGGGLAIGVIYENTIDYITISSTGNASDFGDITQNRMYLSACSNDINERGVFGGGTTGSYTNVMDYITISSTGNATDFGDLTVARIGLSATSNGIKDRGVFGGVWSYSCDYITISTTGDAILFGNLTSERRFPGATSNA